MTLSVRRCLVPLLLLFVGCHDVPQAPKTVPPGVAPWVRITMDDGVTDYPSWGGLNLLSHADTEFDFVVAEAEYGTLHYGGCVQNCQDPSRWLVGTIDSGTYGLGENASTVRTANEVVVAYEDYQTPAQPFVRIGICGGACYQKASWQFGDARPGLLGSFQGTHSRGLAADPSGGLHLLYHDSHDLTLSYAECTAACTDSASWHSTFLDSANFQGTDVALAVGANGVVHILAEGDSAHALTYFSCDTGCTSRGNWGSVILATGLTGHTPSILTSPSGILYVTYGRAPVFATCAASCLTLASWTFTQLKDTSGTDVALTLDASEHPWVAISHGPTSNYGGTSSILHCTAVCGTAGSWTTTTIDSLGDGLDISMILDGTGQPRVAVSGNGVHYAQRPDTTLLAYKR